MNRTNRTNPSRVRAFWQGLAPVPSPHFSLFPSGRLLPALCALVLACNCLPLRTAAAAQPSRFLLIFETSPVLKKNLPKVRDAIDTLFASNLQNEMKTDDDLAVWTVDEKLHTDTYALASWAPDDASSNAERLDDFLGHQHFSRRASLDPIQPLLNRVARSSDHLTVLIFCDSQSRLSGTPYDGGVNEIITNATARLKGSQTTFIVVLRIYHGQYLGCSVNRSGLLNIPPFPQPPKPAPAPMVNPVLAPASVAAPTPAPAPVITGPVVTPVPALIIVGTNAGTNVSMLAQAPPAVAVAVPAAKPLATNPGVAVPPVLPTPAPTLTSGAATNSPPVSARPFPVAPPPALRTTSAPESGVVSAMPTSAPAVSPPEVPASNAMPVKGETAPPDAGYLVPLVLAGVALLAAIGLVVGVVVRARRPHGSLISSSMHDDSRQPPRK